MPPSSPRRDSSNRFNSDYERFPDGDLSPAQVRNYIEASEVLYGRRGCSNSYFDKLQPDEAMQQATALIVERSGDVWQAPLRGDILTIKNLGDLRIL